MKTQRLLNKLQKPLLAIAALAVLASCGSSQNAPQNNNDGIYGDADAPAEGETSVSNATPQSDKRNYYKQYFQTKAKLYEEEPEDDVIFTDVEGYTSSNEYVGEDGYIYEDEEIPYEEDYYGGWGEQTENVTVNIYNNNAGFGYYGWNRPHWWYGSGWGLSIWHGGWGWGSYYGPGWGGYYNPYWGWNNPYYWHGGAYPYYAYSPYRSNNWYSQVAYNRGRRNSDYYPGRTSRRIDGRSNTSTNRNNSSYSRREISRRVDANRNNQNVRRSTRSTTREYNRPTTRQQNTRTAPRQRQYNNTRNNSSNNRAVNRSTRSTNTRSSGNVSRGSTTTRSSSSSARTSSGRRGGGR